MTNAGLQYYYVLTLFSVDGLLRRQGITVQRYRIRETLHVVDLEGVQCRLRGVLHGRQ